MLNQALAHNLARTEAVCRSSEKARIGIQLCGWHDFRHSLTTELRRKGTHPKVVSDLLGHKKVNLAMDVYDRSSLQDFERALGQVVGNQLLLSCDPKGTVQ